MNLLFDRGLERVFGTYRLDGARLDRAVAVALDTGYRAFDTAQGYGNEADLGHALRAARAARDHVFVITKVAPENCTRADFLPSVAASLARLRLDHVDLLLIHWPDADGANDERLEQLQEARARGMTRHIGVSNFTAAMMADAQRKTRNALVVNQVEFHPLLDQHVVQEASARCNLPLLGYSTIARGRVFREPVLQEIADRHRRTPGQIALRWALQKGVAVTTGSGTPAHIRANFAITDFGLSADEMARIDALNATNYRVVAAERIPWAPVFD